MTVVPLLEKLPSPKISFSTGKARLQFELPFGAFYGFEDSVSTLRHIRKEFNDKFPEEQRQWLKDHMTEKLSP